MLWYIVNNNQAIAKKLSDFAVTESGPLGAIQATPVGQIEDLLCHARG